jgi:hypothetical protein
VLQSERLTGALLDRLIHHVHILVMNGDTYGLKESNQSKLNPSRKSDPVYKYRHRVKTAPPVADRHAPIPPESGSLLLRNRGPSIQTVLTTPIQNAGVRIPTVFIAGIQAVRRCKSG